MLDTKFCSCMPFHFKRFDIHGLEIASKQDEEGIKSAAVKGIYSA